VDVVAAREREQLTVVDADEFLQAFADAVVEVDTY
jgi:hypothetical protein